MDNVMSLSKTAIKILQILQNNPKASQSELADKAGMSRSSFWRHVKDMEESGIILDRNIEFDSHKIGLQIKANCHISLNNHSNDSRKQFELHITQMKNVMECYATSGGKDYMLTVVAKDIDNYYDIMSSQILDHPTISSAHTSFLMKKIKNTNKLPL